MFPTSLNEFFRTIHITRFQQIIYAPLHVFYSSKRLFFKNESECKFLPIENYKQSTVCGFSLSIRYFSSKMMKTFSKHTVLWTVRDKHNISVRKTFKIFNCVDNVLTSQNDCATKSWLPFESFSSDITTNIFCAVCFFFNIGLTMWEG